MSSDHSRRRGEAPRVQHVFLEHLIGRIDLFKHHVVAPEVGEMLEHAPGVRIVELLAVDDVMTQHQAAVAGEVDIDDLDIGVGESDVILARQLPAKPAIAALVVNGIDPDAGLHFDRRADGTSGTAASAAGSGTGR